MGTGEARRRRSVHPRAASDTASSAATASAAAHSQALPAAATAAAAATTTTDSGADAETGLLREVRRRRLPDITGRLQRIESGQQGLEFLGGTRRRRISAARAPAHDRGRLA